MLGLEEMVYSFDSRLYVGASVEDLHVGLGHFFELRESGLEAEGEQNLLPREQCFHKGVLSVALVRQVLDRSGASVAKRAQKEKLEVVWLDCV